MDRVWGRYHLKRLIARGGMAEVYQATRRGPSQFAKQVCLKCILPDLSDNHEFIQLFETLIPIAENSGERNEELCFLLRTLLIDKYRRILLTELELPPELVPEDCLSHQARAVTEKLYKLICIPAEDFFMRISESANGVLPPVDKEYFTRFGGLPG